MKLALENPTGNVFFLSKQQFEEGVIASRESPRRRMMKPIHRRQDAPVQRMVNFLQADTYVQPHQHPGAGSSETIQMISGRLAFIVFDEEGAVEVFHILERGDLIDIEEQVWHGLLVLEPDTAFLEAKRGPFDATDRIFAEWAPKEGAPNVDEYLKGLKTRLGL